MNLSKLSLAVISVFGLICVTVNGASIPLSNSGWTMIVTEDGTGSNEVYAPYIYGTGNDSVTVEIDKVFNAAFNGQSYTPVSISFEKTSANAVSNIIINDEHIVNNTGTEWFDFHMSLLNPTGGAMAGFNSSYIPSGDQFENVSYSNYNGFNGLPTQVNFVDADGQGVLADFIDNVFMPGYASGQLVIVTNPQMAVGSSFTLLESPSVPEPTTVLLLGMGGLAVLKKKRRAQA